jgi:hypothetical protein
MIERPTVLILGAGASAHLDYPLGRGLLSRLCQLRWEPDIDRLSNKWPKDQITDFLTRLSRAGYSSVDEFLEKNSEYVDLGKYLIARELKKKEDPDRLFPPHNSGWYKYLFSSLLVHDQPEFEENNVTIVTFNYDRSLEAYLDLALQSRYKISDSSAQRICGQLPILHVHGILGQYPAVSYSKSTDSENELLEISKQIQIISEIQDKTDAFCNAQFEQANRYLRQAQRIFFLGFGFNSNNIRRFQFFNKDSLERKEVRATNQGFRGAILVETLERLESFGIIQEVFAPSAPTCELFFERAARFQ